MKKINWLPLLGSLAIVVPMMLCIVMLAWHTGKARDKLQLEREQVEAYPATNVITININFIK